MSLEVSSRHSSVAHFAPYFEYGHLAGNDLQEMSRACAELAQEALDWAPDGPELSAGLRKLLEAKDCFVRAVLAGRQKRMRGNGDNPGGREREANSPG